MFKLTSLYNKFTMSMKYLIYIVVLFSLCMCNLKIGDLAPDFTLQDQYGKSHTLKQYREKNVILYFYPKDFTPGCTKQACSIRDINNDLINKNAIVLGLSYDSNKKHEGFSKKHNLNKYLGVISCGYKGAGFKLNHMKEIMEKYPDIEENRIVFFDDDKYNFTEINLVTDIKTILINHENGVTFDDITF